MRPPCQALATLEFIVVGGGLAGVACAYALRRSGHTVTVIEKADGKHRGRGSVDCPPNLSRVLKSWGLGSLLKKHGVLSTQFDFVSGRTGKVLGRTQFMDSMFEELGAHFYTLQHGDFYEMLFDLAVSVGVRFMFEQAVESIDAWMPSVTLADGRVLTADVIVGADGHASFVRKLVLDSEGQSIKETPNELGMYVATVSKSLMANHPDPHMQELARASEIATAWMGPGSSVFGEHIHDGLDFIVKLYAPLLGDELTETWDTKYPVEGIRSRISGYDPRVRQIFEWAETVTPTQCVVRESPPSWVHASGRVVIIGEAAHPLTPYGSNNAALSIEDASILGGLFSHIGNKAHIGILLAAFEELREPRCANTMILDPQGRFAASLPDGPMQQARDQTLLVTLDLDMAHSPDEWISAALGAYIQTFQYDADDAVDEWYSRWGRWFTDRERAAEPQSMLSFTRTLVSVSRPGTTFRGDENLRGFFTPDTIEEE